MRGIHRSTLTLTTLLLTRAAIAQQHDVASSAPRSTAPASDDTASSEPDASSSPAPRRFIVHAPERRHEAEGIPVGALLVVGVGVLGFAASGIFFVLQNDAISECQQSPGLITCATPEAFDRAQAAHAYNAAVNVSLVVGLAGVVIGGLWLLAGSRTPDVSNEARWNFDVSPVAGGAVLTWGGRL